ncbi:30S ribosomal protein S18 [Rickettsiaceae bacterium]|nr:30S ribosomal protein S18 [Rickettsiaceae bacterium]
MSKEQISRSSSNTRSDTRGQSFFKRSKGCPLCATSAPVVNYKNPDLLKSFISNGGRMLPSRVTNVCAKHQRRLKREIKRSRLIALLPFVFTQ